MTRLGLAAVALVLPFIVACTAGTNAQGPTPAELLPDRFPVPQGAQTVTLPGASAPSVVTLRVPQPGNDVVGFYATQLPAAGWEVEQWEGTGPTGDPTSGFIIERDGETGALSVTAADDDNAIVQINMHQPTQPTEGSMPDTMHGDG